MVNVETKIEQQIDEYIGKAGSAIPYNKLLADVLTSIIDQQKPIVLTPSSLDDNNRTLNKESYLKVIDAYKENKMQNLVLSVSRERVKGMSYITNYVLFNEYPGLGQIYFGELIYDVCLGDVVISTNEELPIEGVYTTSTIANAFGLSEDDWLALWNGEVVIACPNMDSEFPFDCLSFMEDKSYSNMKHLYNILFDHEYGNFRVIRHTDEDKWRITTVVDTA